MKTLENRVRGRWPCAVGMICLLAGMLAGQPATAVFDFEPIGVDSTQTAILGTLLRDRLTDTRAIKVLVPSRGIACYTQAAAESLGPGMGAQKAVIGNVMKVGGRLLISYKLVDLVQKVVEFSDRTSFDNEAQLDATSQRIAQSIADKKPFTLTLEAGKAIEAGAKEMLPREPMSSILFTTGYSFPLAGSGKIKDAGMLFNLNVAMTYEMPGMITLAQMGIGTAGSVKDLHFELLAHRLGSNKDIAPFFGGGLGVHRIWLPGYTGTGGLSASANAGMLFFRSYYFRVIANAKASVLVTRDAGVVPSVGVNFGLTSPGMGPGGRIQTPPACLYGMLGTFFVIGLVTALAS